MKSNNLYVDIHVLQNVPPSCINRDDTGSPKTAKYGGAVRARVSSQAWKHEMRKMFAEELGQERAGMRTRHVADMIAGEIRRLNSDIDEKEALRLAKEVSAKAGIKLDKDGQSAVLMFFSVAQARALAELGVQGETDKSVYKEALKAAPSVDMALFGRMLADDASLNYDAAAQVAHAISTHAVHNEYDYFTAVDDLNSEDQTGAGHLGTVEFNSSTLYRYATVNVLELKRNLGADTVDAVTTFVEAFVKSMPTGKQNSFANRTFPDYVYVTIRVDQPVNLCGAFEQPVSSKNGYLEASKAALGEYADTVYRKYACEPEVSWNLDDDALPQMLQGLRNTLTAKLSESEDG